MNQDRAIDCAEVLRHLAEIADGADDSEVPCSAMREHAAHCETCARAMVQELHVRTMLRRCCQENAPSALRSRIITRIVTTRQV